MTPPTEYDDVFETLPGAGDDPRIEQPHTRRALRELSTPPPRRRRGCAGPAIGLLIFALLGGVGVTWAWNTFEEPIRRVLGMEEPIDYEGEGHGEAVIVISAGDTGDTVARTLADAGVTKTWDAFYKLLLAQNPPTEFYPGSYSLRLEMSASAALAALADPANKVDNTVLIHEGKSITQVMTALSEGTGIPLSDFEAAAADPSAYGVPAAAPSLEGYLFPARYEFAADATAASIIQTLVTRTFSALDAAGVAPDDRHRVLTLASILQREAGSNRDDFYKVSRVFLNRLADGWKLESDATVAYGADSTHTVWTKDEDRADASNLYNTYANPGLPVGPISSAGDLAIDAAQHPAEGPWFFFVPVNLETGETVFSVTYAEHQRAVTQLQRWCSETKSPNCA